MASLKGPRRSPDGDPTTSLKGPRRTPDGDPTTSLKELGAVAVSVGHPAVA